MSPRTGRPKSENPRTKVIPIRFNEAEHALVQEAAEKADVPASQWVRETAVTKAKRAARKP